ncbi:MAG: hypothetical protein HOO00_05070 [Rhodospirillaceae bacterium]|jgi:hypothetical protein|nr:hypothetical protein [Rhodospirillaceae bacterium]MBT5374064.1 hypothetical protein [Rhodospirillaceae bacterium]MBT5751501.1 hypothetical protein [Rhodospirillaceae bacterium]
MTNDPKINDPELVKQAIGINAKAFKGILPGLLETDRDKFALVREGKLVKLFNKSADAVKFAVRTYPDGFYLNLKINEESLDVLKEF